MPEPDDAPYQPYRPDPTPEPEPEAGAAPYPPYAVEHDRPAVATSTPASPQRLGLPFFAVAIAITVVVVAFVVVVARMTGGPVEVATPTGTVMVDSGSIGRQLEDKRDLYTDALQEEDLPSVGLEDTRFNRVAIAAFSFFLTDMISATNVDPDDEDAVGYMEDAAEYERLLLAGEPLGDDIEIVFSEDRVFRYDGATGEGGYSDE